MTPNITKDHTDTSKFLGKGPTSAEESPSNNPVQQYNPDPGAKAPAFSSEGAVGKQFKADGAIGGMAQKIGGPLDKDGMIGGAFKEDGAIGGTMNKAMGHNPGDNPT